MTIMTAGHLLINEALPDDLQVTESLHGKQGVPKLLRSVGEKHPHRYGEIVNRLKEIGNEVAYHSGTSFTLDDYAPETQMRDAAFGEHAHELTALRRGAVNNTEIQSHPEFQKKKLSVLAKVEEQVNGHVADAVKTRPNNLTNWVTSGARGDSSMARQMVAMAGLNVDMTNKLVPDIARRSFAEGLSPIDFHVHANGARRGVVNTYTSVRDPGAFAKELNTLAMDMVVAHHDCGTKHGRTFPAGDVDILDRALAEDVPGVGHRNDVVTTAHQAAMKKLGIPHVKVRSPLHCELSEGVCAHCFGLNEEGNLPKLGEHVGLKASQAITEPLTQLALNTKHSGGVVGAGKSPLQQILQFMHAPKTFTGAAVLAKRSGKVERVTPAAAGGFHVHIEGVKHYVGPDQEVKVAPGTMVTRGTMLSTGQAHPGEVVHHMGMERGREYFADSVKNLYADSGIRGHGKIFETISRSALNLGEVVTSGDTHHAPGELVHWNAIAPRLRENRSEVVPIEKAQGRILATDHEHLQHFQVLSPKAAKELKAKNLTHVTVYHPDDLVVKPVMLGTERAAMHKGDWMAALGYRFIGTSFKENAAVGSTANIHSFNPIPAYAYGAEFGKGEGGRY